VRSWRGCPYDGKENGHIPAPVRPGVVAVSPMHLRSTP
jgi:hypothetical protein